MAQGEIDLSEEAEASWRTHVADFRAQVWPIMQELGFTEFQTAFMVWSLNRISNDIKNLHDWLEEAHG